MLAATRHATARLDGSGSGRSSVRPATLGKHGPQRFCPVSIFDHSIGNPESTHVSWIRSGLLCFVCRLSGYYGGVRLSGPFIIGYSSLPSRREPGNGNAVAVRPKTSQHPIRYGASCGPGLTHSCEASSDG
jgi:hypothetical protein